MSSSATSGKEEDEIHPPQRPPSPPPHTTFAARGVHTPTFSAFRPRDVRITSSQAMTHVAWNCDGKKLAAVGIDRIARVWQPEKSMEMRTASLYSGGHTDDADYVSWNPTHPELFCSSSQKDRRIVFWDARQSRHIQQITLKILPVQTNYSPDGKTLLYVSAGHQLLFMTYGQEGDEPKEQWHTVDRKEATASTGMFNHVGDGVILTHNSEHTIRILDYPSLAMRESPAAHVGGCVAAALDPRGRYLASGGHDSIVNMFDMADWICARTITSCEHSITDLSFSHDGEYLAISSTGPYIDICATETGVPLHRVPALAPSPTVSWHPSKYAIAYCGQTKLREGGPPPVAVMSLFGPGI
ncbi:WD40 repeat-like protein [Artomyces pyxidatus]|uniref:WD40 repeat-like protein n=1 Tax=Artomyces pyxidatus TaxID=48021 RepID=A0ACB8SMW2_9AGAM|nr:WD40 repeat-like protein [Artomyces pyxidatus]